MSKDPGIRGRKALISTGRGVAAQRLPMKSPRLGGWCATRSTF
jgi:hypothetical protein